MALCSQSDDCTFQLCNRQDICPAFLCIITLFLCSYNPIYNSFLYALLINHHSISHNGIGTDGIVSLSYRIPGVSFHGINSCPVTAFHNTHMVTRSIMIPVEKDDCTGTRHTPCPLPSSLILKPVLSISAERKLWNCPALDQSCLIRAPGHKACTPFLPAVKSIP